MSETTDKAPATAPLTANKLKALEALAKAPEGLTRTQLAQQTGIAKGWSKLLGAATKGTPAPGTLEGDGLVQSAVTEGTSARTYTITPRGRKALAAAKGGK